MVPLTATGPEVYVDTMTTVLSGSYDSLVYTLNHMKSLKIKDHLGGNVEDCFDAILVDVEHLEIAGDFKPKKLGYIIRIFEDTSDYIFHISVTQKYKKEMEFVKKIIACDKDVIKTNNIITYGFLVQ